MDVREALLRAATTVFAEVGTRGATTRRIAREAGVNEVTLFRHFKSKDDLIQAALERFAHEVTEPSLPATPVNPREELVAWCRRRHRGLHKVRALVRKSMGEFEEYPDHCSQGLDASVRIANELTSYLRRLKETGLAAGDWDERTATAMLMGALFTDAMGRDTTPERFPYSMRDAVNRYVDFLLRAIGATDAPSPARRSRRATTMNGSKTTRTAL